jgi:hypothetical protein
MILLAISSLVFAMTAVLPKVMQDRIKNSGRTLFEVFISLFSFSSFCPILAVEGTN